MLLVELENMQADVICLQEVQMDHYEAHILPYMNELGYDAVYKQKSRESMGLYGKVRIYYEICGIVSLMLCHYEG